MFGFSWGFGPKCWPYWLCNTGLIVGFGVRITFWPWPADQTFGLSWCIWPQFQSRTCNAKKTNIGVSLSFGLELLPESDFMLEKKLLVPSLYHIAVIYWHLLYF